MNSYSCPIVLYLRPVSFCIIIASLVSCSTPAESGIRGNVFIDVCGNGQDTIAPGIAVTFIALDSSGTRTYTSDSAGQFELYLPPGEYKVKARPARETYRSLNYYQPYSSDETWTIKPGEFLEKEIKLFQSGFRGRIYGGPDSTSSPLGNARIFVTDSLKKIQMAVSRADGNFELLVAPGKYFVEVSHPSFEKYFSGIPVWTAGRECLEEVKVFLRPRK